MDTANPKQRKNSRGMLAVSLLMLIFGVSISIILGSYVVHPDAPPVPPTPALTGNAVRVMTFNIRIDSSSDGSNAWQYRRDAVAKLIRNYEADVIGAQEADFGQIGDLAERLPGYSWIGVGSNGGESGATDPIFWRVSRFEMLDNGTFWLSTTPTEPSTGWDAAYPRTVSWVHLRIIDTDETLYVFNTHFDHRGRDAKLHSARLMVNRIRRLPADSHVVFMGDLNSVPGSAALEALEQGGQLGNAYDLSRTGNRGAANSFMGFRQSRWTGRRIDHVYVQNLAVEQHAIIGDKIDGRKPSDHYPVVADVLID